MKTARAYLVALAPLALLAVVGVLGEAASVPLSAAVLFWGTVAGGVHCLAVLGYDLFRSRKERV